MTHSASHGLGYRIASGCLVLAGSYYILVAILRLQALIPLDQPATFFSTGFEEESLFTIWRVAKGEPAYMDSSQVPFAQPYFNWLFYATYGAVARLAFFAHLAEDWLPTLMRLLSAAFVLVLGGLVWRMAEIPGRIMGAAAAALSVLHPSYLFSLFFARPDVLALALETGGLACYLVFIRDQRRRQFIASVLLLYAAWSVKHSFIQATAALGAHLLFTRRYRLLVGYMVVVGGAVAVTLWLGGQDYRYALLFSQQHCDFSLTRSLGLATNCLIRMPQITVGLAVLVLMLYRTWRVRRLDEQELVIGLTMLAGLGLALVAGGKAGAASNYYIAPALYACILVVRYVGGTLENAARGAATTPRGAVFPWTWLCFALLMAVPLTYGKSTLTGIAQTRQQWRTEADAVRDLQRLIPNERPPVFVISQYFENYEGAGNLPWVNPHPPHLVLAYTYPWDRRQGRSFQYDGLGGMIRSGMIPTIISAANKNYDQIDGADLSAYGDREIQATWRIYRLTERAGDASP